MSGGVKTINLNKELDFINKKIDNYQAIIFKTKNLDLKINIMHLVNHYVKEREKIINKFNISEKT